MPSSSSRLQGPSDYALSEKPTAPSQEPEPSSLQGHAPQKRQIVQASPGKLVINHHINSSRSTQLVRKEPSNSSNQRSRHPSNSQQRLKQAWEWTGDGIQIKNYKRKSGNPFKFRKLNVSSLKARDFCYAILQSLIQRHRRDIAASAGASQTHRKISNDQY